MSLPYNSYHTGAEVDAAVDRANALWIISGNQVAGTIELGNGVDSGTVTGLALSFNPLQIFLQVECPLGLFNIFGVVIAGTLLADGFQFALSGETDTATYKLHYLIIGEAIGGSSGSSSES